MRFALAAFLVGALIGATTTLGIFTVVPRGEDGHAAEMLDILIEEWAPDRDITIAGIPARLELADPHPGFFRDTARAPRVELLYEVPVPGTFKAA